jgi:fumarate reductase flavoprotein subunit
MVRHDIPPRRPSKDDKSPSAFAPMSAVSFDCVQAWDAQVPLLIVGAGATGLCAALAAKEAGAEAIVIERDAAPSGSTALSAELIPAAGTRFQRAKGLTDSPEQFAADIQRKARGKADTAVVESVVRGSAPLIEWLTNRHALPFELVDNFNYPGHCALRMHGLQSRTGRELIDRLRDAAEQREIVILTEVIADRLFAEVDGRVRGAEVVRGDGTRERIGCGALILACNGYGGNPELVGRFIPEMADALYSVIPAIAAMRCCGARHSALSLSASAPTRATAQWRHRTTS